MEIVIPWNLTTYYAKGAFHPLYRPLFDLGLEFPRNHTRHCYNILDEVSFARQLQENPKFIKDIQKNIVEFQQKTLEKWNHSESVKEFISWHGIQDLWLTYQLPGTIELHHTCPSATGERPYILHCESFLPTFMPFAFQGQGKMKNPEKVRKFYRSILENERCLGIISHLQATLDQFSVFFDSPIINAKLSFSPIGLGDSTYRFLETGHKQMDKTCFLFTSSAHQLANNLISRGLCTSLTLAQMVLPEYPSAQFVFRCWRPTDAKLRDMGINDVLIRQAEQDGRVCWIQGHRSEEEQLSLFQQADFFLLPSANLHSVSIMQAQLAGAVPIVSDTYGTEMYVEDGTTGIVIPGVKENLWYIDAGTGIPVDDHSLFTAKLAYDMAVRIKKRIAFMLSDKAALIELQAKAKHHAAQNYTGYRFRNYMLDQLDISMGQPEAKLSNAIHPPVLPKTVSSEKFFRMSPLPQQIEENKIYNLFEMKGIYAAVSKNISPKDSNLIGSPLNAVNSDLLCTNRIVYSEDLNSLKTRIRGLKPRGSRSIASLLSNGVKLTRRIARRIFETVGIIKP